MKILIIPDVHLKPWMFTDADKKISELHPDRTLCLGDLVDDWGCQDNSDIYRETLNVAYEFQQNHSDTLWCFGNHDLAYLWNVWVSGTANDEKVRAAARDGLKKLYNSMPAENLAYVHRIDDVLFSHAGISRMFVREHFALADYEKVDRIIDGINNLRMEDMWNDDSPIWLRPQGQYAHFPINMYKSRTFLQVVGHSPMKEITREKNILSCDVFSTYRDRTPYGSHEFCLLDTESWNWKGLPAGQHDDPIGASLKI